MPRAFSEREKGLINERLLEQGRRQFSTYGLKKTSVAELAQAAGISKGTFYLFYESKEALFLAVVARAEIRYREEVLAAIEGTGRPPRARLHAVFRRAVDLWKELPILQAFTYGDYDLLLRNLPDDMVKEHVAGYRKFVEELVRRCIQVGIPVTARPGQIADLLHVITASSVRGDEFGPENLPGTIDLLLDLLVAFCLGEISRESSS